MNLKDEDLSEALVPEFLLVTWYLKKILPGEQCSDKT